MPPVACLFDAYGTLFDVAGAARAAAAEPGAGRLAEVWPRLAEDWRGRQLHYTWLRAAMGRHADFATVTADALDWALAAHGIADAALRARLIALYDRLPAYPEAAATLAALAARGLPSAILSNGTPAMLRAATRAAGLDGHLADILSVETAGIFKPAPAVYAMGAARFGGDPARIGFVSANGWDAAAAAAFGFRAVWVNRAGAPPERLPGTPAATIPDLAALPGLLDRL